MLINKRPISAMIKQGEASIVTVKSLEEKPHKSGGGADYHIRLQKDGESVERYIRVQLHNTNGEGVERHENFGALEQLLTAQETGQPVAFGTYMFSGSPRIRVGHPEVLADIQSWVSTQIGNQKDYYANKRSETASTGVKSVASLKAPVTEPVPAGATDDGMPF